MPNRALRDVFEGLSRQLDERIARRIGAMPRVAERHGGRLRLDASPLGGLRAEVRLPPLVTGRE
jgi:signal transduction histidine kinase